MKYKFLVLLSAWLAVVGCSDDSSLPTEEPIPEGYGRLQLTVGTPDGLATRAVSTTTPWLQGTDEERAIRSYHLLMCDDGGNIVMTFSGSATSPAETALNQDDHEDDPKNHFPVTQTFTSDLLSPGTYTYTFYCLANFTDAMMAQSGLTVSSGAITSTTLPSGFDEKAILIANTTTLPATGMPMTGKLNATVTIESGINTTQDTSGNDLILILWRMMAKLQFDFVNESAHQMDIVGLEIEPLNDGTVGTPLWQRAVDLSSTANDAGGTLYVVGADTPADDTDDVVNAPWEITPTSPATTLASVPAKSGTTNGTATLTVYVNETDATYTAVRNQFSLRFKVLRAGTVNEYRYAITTPYIDGLVGGDGFNVIRRNDWIHLPIRFSDWQFQIEALPFPPIAGFQARMVTADAQSITFNTGGYIVLHPMFRKTTDPGGMWKTFDDADVTFTLSGNESGYDATSLTTSYAKMIADDTGIEMAGDLDIFDQKFVQLPSGDIVGKLTNADTAGRVTVTLHVKLGQDPKLQYQFTYTIIKV